MQTLASLPFTTFSLATMPRGGDTNRRRSKSVKNQVAPPLHHHQITQSLSPEKIELFKSLEPWASQNILPLLKPVEKSWQPSEFLPDPTRPVDDFVDEVRALRERTNGLPDEYFVALVGDMITEEALPTYQTALNTLAGVNDETGVSPSPWATWIRAWSAEENRHGDLLRTYLYLSGRVDMLKIERTIQYLIRAGMEHSNWENNPYLGFVYTTFQERATFIVHGNTARLAKEGGDHVLAKICGTIAADEKRHENAYAKVIEKLLEIDPNETMVAIGKMLRSSIVMPSHLMYDGQDPQLFRHFGNVSEMIGTYTSDDYVDVLEALIGRWRLDKVEGLKGDGKCEQELVCNLPQRIKRIKVLMDQRPKKEFKRVKFNWIFNKEIII